MLNKPHKKKTAVYEVCGVAYPLPKIFGTKLESGGNDEDFKEVWISLNSDEFISEVR